MACILVVNGVLLDFNTLFKFLEVHSAAPFVQRNCCAFKALISTGNSDGETTSSKYKNFHPLSCAL